MAHLPFGIHGSAFGPGQKTCDLQLLRITFQLNAPPVSFLPLCQKIQDDSEIASSASCATQEDADIASSVSKAMEVEQEPNEELSKAPEKRPIAPDSSIPCINHPCPFPFTFQFYQLVLTSHELQCFICLVLLQLFPLLENLPLKIITGDFLHTHLSPHERSQHFVFLLQMLNFFPRIPGIPSPATLACRISFAPCPLKIWNSFLRFSLLACLAMRSVSTSWLIWRQNLFLLHCGASF